MAKKMAKKWRRRWRSRSLLSEEMAKSINLWRKNGEEMANSIALWRRKGEVNRSLVKKWQRNGEVNRSLAVTLAKKWRSQSLFGEKMANFHRGLAGVNWNSNVVSFNA